MTTLIIGREASTGQLRICVNSIPKVAGAKDSVPKSVSREHVKLTCEDETDIVVENLNIENDTFINGVGIERKRIVKGDEVALGADRYAVDWNVLLPFVPIDISPLKKVWDDFEQQRMAMQIRQGRFNALRMVLFGFSALAAGAAKMLFGLSDAVSVFSAMPTLLFAIWSFKMTSDIPQKQKALQEEAMEKYCCPRCGHLYPLQPYKLLRQMKACPGCQGVIKKKKD